MFGSSIRQSVQEAIDQILKGRFREVMEDENIQKRFENIIRLAKIKAEDKERIRKITQEIFYLASGISSFDLQLKYEGEKIREATADLKKVSEELTHVFQTIADNQQELADASTDMSESLQDIVKKVTVIEQNTIHNAENILSIEESIAKINQEAKEMETHVLSFVDISKEITDAMSGIQTIAEQTNLLALNASIEAARSGEAGKGFTVVAEEIRKLSDNTKDFLETITQSLVKMNQFSQKSQKSVEITANNINTVNEQISQMNESVSESKSNVMGISENLSQIAAYSEELTASTEEVSSTIEEVAQMAENVADSASRLDDVSEHLLSLSNNLQEVEGTAIDLTAESSSLANHPFYNWENDDFIRLFSDAIAAHKKWMQTLKTMVEEMKIYPLQTDDRKCKFGHFYHGIRPIHKGVVPLWEEVDNVHHQLHGMGQKAMEAIQSHDQEQARKNYEEAATLSAKLLNLFETLIQKAKALSEQRECIFCIIS